MVSPASLVDKLKEHSINLFTGVPCSCLSSLIKCISNREDVKYFTLNNEGEALAFASGAYLAGQKPVVMTQNSGLGNMINPLTSLCYPYKIPILLICTWRGQPGIQDEPQHDLMGSIMPKMLSMLSVKNTTLLKNDQSFKVIEKSLFFMKKYQLPYGLIISEDTFESCSLDFESHFRLHCVSNEGNLDLNRELEKAIHTRFEVLKEISDIIGTSLPIITTTGKSSRELYLYRDAPNIFYLLGAMGCASSIAFGIATFLSNRKVIIIDGDGSALMRLEALASIGYYKPKNLIHILLDNGTYDSTGGQDTLSNGIPLEKIATTCGYSYATNIISISKLQEELRKVLSEEGPSFLRVRILPGSFSPLPRPSIQPYEIKERFMDHLSKIREINTIC